MSDHMLIVKWSAQEGWNKPFIVPFGAIPIQPSSSVLHYGLEVKVVCAFVELFMEWLMV